MHTELILPSKTEKMDWLQYVDVEKARDNGFYVAFGWGDRGWYLMASDKPQDYPYNFERFIFAF